VEKNIQQNAGTHPGPVADEAALRSAKEGAWRHAVEAHYASAWVCSNCGASDHLAVLPVIPFAAGGQYVVSNAALLCTHCLTRTVSLTREQRDVVASLSLEIPAQAHAALRDGNLTGVIEQMMTLLVQHPARYETLDTRIPVQASDVRVNVRISRDLYEDFKAHARLRRCSIRRLVCALLLYRVSLQDAQTLLPSEGC